MPHCPRRSPPCSRIATSVCLSPMPTSPPAGPSATTPKPTLFSATPASAFAFPICSKWPPPSYRRITTASSNCASTVPAATTEPTTCLPAPTTAAKLLPSSASADDERADLARRRGRYRRLWQIARRHDFSRAHQGRLPQRHRPRRRTRVPPALPPGHRPALSRNSWSSIGNGCTSKSKAASPPSVARRNSRSRATPACPRRNPPPFPSARCGCWSPSRIR